MKISLFSLATGILAISAINLCFCQTGDSTISKISSKEGIQVCSVRPAFFELSVRSLPAINYYPQSNHNGGSDFEVNKLYNVKLNVPVIMSRKLDIIGQLRYRNEQLHLGDEFDTDDREIHFDNLGMSLLLKYDFNNTYFLAGHFGGFLKADKLVFESYASILDYNSSILFGKNMDLGTIGFGALFGNSLGRFRLYPLFIFDYQLSDSWKLEMKLPKEIQLRKILIPDNFYLVGGVEVNAAAYFISQHKFPELKDNEYRRAAVDFRLGIEKEIVDFLWFGVDIGITQPVYSALVQRGKATRSKLFDFDHAVTPYGSFSIFLVPPKNLFHRLR